MDSVYTFKSLKTLITCKKLIVLLSMLIMIQKEFNKSW